MKDKEPLVTSPLLTSIEVADMLRVDASTVRRWIRSGALKGTPLPGGRLRQTYRIERATVDAILADRHTSC